MVTELKVAIVSLVAAQLKAADPGRAVFAVVDEALIITNVAQDAVNKYEREQRLSTAGKATAGAVS